MHEMRQLQKVNYQLYYDDGAICGNSGALKISYLTMTLILADWLTMALKFEIKIHLSHSHEIIWNLPSLPVRCTLIT